MIPTGTANILHATGPFTWGEAVAISYVCRAYSADNGADDDIYWCVHEDGRKAHVFARKLTDMVKT